MVWRSKLWNLISKRRLNADLDEELQFHVDARTRDNINAGMSPTAAREDAIRRFGNRTLAKELTREANTLARIESVVQDLAYAVRSLWKNPGFTAVAILTLAPCIGATSAIFSVVRTVMLEPLPYRDPDRIVTVWETNRGGKTQNVLAPANFVAWTERSRTLEHLGMVEPAGLVMMIDGQPLEVSGLRVSSAVFHALGVQPALGRAYSSAEDEGDHVIVLTHEFWQRRLGGRPGVLDMTIATADTARTVVGVMPPSFTVAGRRADFLIPHGMTVQEMREYRGRGSAYAIARLRDGISLEQATTEMRSVFAQLEREEPQRNASRTVMLFRIQEQTVGEVRPALFALMAAVALVLVVACVNVANLLLARSAAREREVGTRTALGAGRGRLIRQMVTESLVLACAGGVAGLGVATLCHSGLLALVGDRIPVPRLDQVALDFRVVAFTMIAALTTGVVFGVVPAFISTSHPGDALREGGRHGGGRRLHRVLGSLVVAEVALSLVLLAGASLLMRSFLKLQSIDPGFRAEGVLTAQVKLPPARYDMEKAAGVLREVMTRVEALPGVQAVGGATCMPVPFACIGTSFWRVDRPKPPDGQTPTTEVRPITPGLLATMGIPRIAGRDFSEFDTVDSLPVAIVSQQLASQQFPGESPLGRSLRVSFDHANGRNDVEWTIVGVVGNTRSTLDGPVRQTVYVPRTQRPTTSITLFIRTAQDPASVASSVSGLVRSMEPEAPVNTRLLEDVVGRTIAQPRALSMLVAAFALAALALAAVGVYGVMAYSVRERTQEIGVRMALGASAASVCRLVLGQALRLVFIGAVTGVVVAGALTHLLERLLFEVEPLDPWTFVVTPIILLLVAAIASYVPARRAMHMAPLDALRTN
jgi:putative ABC transport system permease protein